jgi:hypothetical protein
MLRLLVTANVVPSSLNLVTLMMQAIRSSEPSVLTRSTLLNISEGDILHSDRRENLRSYIRIYKLFIYETFHSSLNCFVILAINLIAKLHIF